MGRRSEGLRLFDVKISLTNNLKSQIIMFTNIYFWLAIIFLIWSVICNSAGNNFNGTKAYVGNHMTFIGLIGTILGLIRLVFLGIHFSWYYGVVAFVLSVTIGSYILKISSHYVKTAIGLVGIIGIPLVWYFGGLF